MLRGDWRKISAVFGLALLASSGQAQEQQNEPERAGNEQQESAKPFAIPVDIVEEQKAAEARQRREKETAQREQSDLIAQQGMNAATKRMADYAFWQTILIAIGTAALLYTLYLTRQANRAAWAAVETTEDYGRKQIRAYLGGVSAEIVEDGSKGYYCYVTIKNFGQSPAEKIEVKMRAQYNITAQGADSCTEKRPYGKSLPNHPRSLAPGATGLCAIYIDRSFVDKILAESPKEIRFYYMVDIWWFDVYGAEREIDEQYAHLTVSQKLGTWNKQQPIGEMEIHGSEPSGSYPLRH